MTGRMSPKRIACVAVLVVLALVGGEMAALALSACIAGALAILAIAEAGRLRRPAASASGAEP